MPRNRSTQDQTTLEMALIGYEVEKRRIDDRISEIQSQLGRGSSRPVSRKAAVAGKAPAARKRTLSPEARKRIAAAQKRRWAEHRKNKSQEAKEAKAG